MASTSIAGGDTQPEYRYLQEISQMMFVFGDVVDPHTDVLKLVEDIVRNQVIEMLLQSRALAVRRASRYLSPEDLLFLIRYDRAKVNRLRTYLSWKDVRKNAKDSGGDGAGASADVGDGGEDGAGGVDNPIRSRKMKIKLPWELSTVYSEYLAGIGGDEDREEEDEDDIEAHEDSLQRLRDADEATRLMTRDEYVHYSECRQASFTFRKSKKFREFISAGAYLDVKPNDDIIDVLGFLAFEVVRELCVGAVALKQSFEAEKAHIKRLADGSRSRKDLIESGKGIPSTSNGNDAKRGKDGAEAGSSDGHPALADGGKDATDATKKSEANEAERTNGAKRKDVSVSPTSNKRIKANGDGETHKDDDDFQAADESSSCGLFTMPPAKASPLMTSHIREAFARLQRDRAVLSTGNGGSTGGLRRTRVFVI